MDLKKFVKWWYRVSNLEALCIATAIKEKQWQDFKSNRLDRVVFRLANIVL